MARRGSRLTRAFDFDPRFGSTGRYIDRRTGRIVARETVLNAMETQITASRENIGRISTSLAEGEINLAQWQTGMAREMKLIHTQSAALAKGGWDQMSQADWGAVGRLTRDQYAFLENFAIEIESGQQRLRNLAGEVNGQFLRRADLYGQAGAATHSQMERRQARQNAEITHERRVLDPRAQHCVCCPAQAAKGWQPIGNNDLLPIGACDCATNCRCQYEFGKFTDLLEKSQVQEGIDQLERDKAELWERHNELLEEFERLQESGQLEKSADVFDEMVAITQQVGDLDFRIRQQRAILEQFPFQPVSSDELYTQWPELEFMGDSLQVEDLDSLDVRRHLIDLTVVPRERLEQLQDNGVIWYISDTSNGTEMDDWERLKGQQPRGWDIGDTMEDVGGWYDPGNRGVAVGEGNSSSISLMLHETGHAIGDTVNYPPVVGPRIDNSEALIEHHKRLFDKLTPYQQQDGAGGLAGRQEMFAEGFAYVMLLNDKEGKKLVEGRKLLAERYDEEFVEWIESIFL